MRHSQSAADFRSSACAGIIQGMFSDNLILVFDYFFDIRLMTQLYSLIIFRMTLYLLLCQQFHLMKVHGFPVKICTIYIGKNFCVFCSNRQSLYILRILEKLLTVKVYSAKRQLLSRTSISGFIFYYIKKVLNSTHLKILFPQYFFFKV